MGAARVAAVSGSDPSIETEREPSLSQRRHQRFCGIVFFCMAVDDLASASITATGLVLDGYDPYRSADPLRFGN